MRNTILSLLTQLTESRNPEAPRGAEGGVPNDCGKEKSTTEQLVRGAGLRLTSPVMRREGLGKFCQMRNLLPVSPSTSRDWEMVAEAANSTSSRADTGGSKDTGML